MRLSYVSVVSSLLFSSAGYAQQETQPSQPEQAVIATPAMQHPWGLNMQIGQINLTPSAAKRVRFNETATLLTIGGERRWNDYNLSAASGFNIMLYRDKAGFSQNTTQGVKDSSASGGAFYVQAGPQARLGENQAIKLFLHGGYNQVLSNARTIDYCSNCYSEKIKIKSGPYIAAGIGYTYNTINWGVQYVKYSSGDFKDSFGLHITTRF